MAKTLILMVINNNIILIIPKHQYQVITILLFLHSFFYTINASLVSRRDFFQKCL